MYLLKSFMKIAKLCASVAHAGSVPERRGARVKLSIDLSYARVLS